MGDKRPVEPLIAALNNKDSHVIYQAEQALEIWAIRELCNPLFQIKRNIF